MSGNETRNSELEGEGLAFEYVAGTLRQDARQAFEKRMADDAILRREVQFWEQQLMALNTHSERPPRKETWNHIAEAVGATQVTDPVTGAHEKTQRERKPLFQNFWQWAAPTFAAFALMAVLIGYYPGQRVAPTPNTDYVAVLTDSEGGAVLTAMTAGQNRTMWLQWNLSEIPSDRNAQLWAVSKRDGQTRPIDVLASTDQRQLQLSEAGWRLVTDADYLLLTEEEVGGSAIDEPSDILIAKGVCVRFNALQDGQS